MPDLTITHGRWIDAAGTLHDSDLCVREGRVRLGAARAAGDTVIDALGGLILPGAIDGHTHLREPGQEYKEGIDNGTRAALAGGVTTVLDMPNNAPPITSARRLREKAELFRAGSHTHWGLHVQAPVDDPLRLGRHASAKVYMARSSSLPALRDPEALRQVFAAHRRVTVHAEDEACFVTGTPGARTHHRDRPVEAVASALRIVEGAMESLSPEERPRLVLCHASTALEVEWLMRVKGRGWDVWGETCPHYLLLSCDDYVREGPRLQVNPPLRSLEDVAAIRKGLALGTVDFVSTDHAPHSPAEKSDEAGAPSGIPGLERYMPAMLSLVDDGLLSLARLVEVTSRAAARCYGVAGRGCIEDGAGADLAVVSRRARGSRPWITRAGYDAFSHLRLNWNVEATLLSGQLAFAEGVVGEGITGEEVVG